MPPAFGAPAAGWWHALAPVNNGAIGGRSPKQVRLISSARGHRRRAVPSSRPVRRAVRRPRPRRPRGEGRAQLAASGVRRRQGGAVLGCRRRGPRGPARSGRSVARGARRVRGPHSARPGRHRAGDGAGASLGRDGAHRAHSDRPRRRLLHASPRLRDALQRLHHAHGDGTPIPSTTSPWGRCRWTPTRPVAGRAGRRGRPRRPPSQRRPSRQC